MGTANYLNGYPPGSGGPGAVQPGVKGAWGLLAVVKQWTSGSMVSWRERQTARLLGCLTAVWEKAASTEK